MTLVMTVNLVLAAANGLGALLLGITYWRNHREIRSPFTRGLLLFALFLVLHYGYVLYEGITMMSDVSAAVETFLLIENLLAAAALAALIAATMR